MLFYRFLNVVIISFQLQAWLTLNKSNEIANTVGFIGTCLLFANVILAAIFFLAEFLLTKDSKTVVSLKVIHPYTETPVKILLLFTSASTCVSPHVDEFNTLQQLIRLDLIVSYISYAWKSFWPLILTPLNKGLMYINSLALYMLRITRDAIYGVLLTIYEFYQSLKFNLDIACCHVYEDDMGIMHIPLGRRLADSASRTFDCLFDGVDVTLATCGIDVERNFDVSFPQIRCSPSFKVILPSWNPDFYVNLDLHVPNIDLEMPEINVEFHEHFYYGFLQHIKSGRYVHPDGGTGEHKCKLVLGPAVLDPGLVFRFHKDGCIEHDQSELFWHAEKGHAEPGHKLLLHEGGHTRRLEYKLHNDGALENIHSHLFAHVEATGRPYLFLSTIGHQPDAAFRMVPFKKGSERRCLNGHIMRVLFDIPPLYQNVAAIECDKCRRTGLGNPAGTPFYHCPLCKFDTCVECPLALTPQQGGLGKPLVAPTNSNRA